MLFCHATPRDDEEVVLVDSRLDRWQEVFNGLDTDIRTVHFDLQAAATQLSQDSSYPDITEWADYFLHARASDADALAAFAPRDGRDHSP
ncbi:hypothetical protein TNCT1_43060 [Streptomyces sp. 1-11]|nr:hypothetical protein TNCT1_43060 [Streptomyces sp. 1-11]